MEERTLVEAGSKHLTQLRQPRLFGWSGVTGVGSITPSAVTCSNIRMIYCRKQFSRQSWSLSMCWGSIQCKKPLRPPYLVAMGKRRLGEISHAGAPEKWLWISEVRSEEECMCVKETENGWRWRQRASGGPAPAFREHLSSTDYKISFYGLKEWGEFAGLNIHGNLNFR